MKTSACKDHSSCQLNFCFMSISIFSAMSNYSFKYVNSGIFPSAATELVDEPVPVEGRQEEDGSRNLTLDSAAAEQRHEDLLSEVQALTCRMSPLELSRCSPQQLVQMHDQLGGMMRRVVVELQTRVCQTDGKP